MNEDTTRSDVTRTIRARFRELDAWFDRPEDSRRAHQASEVGWTIDEILEHVMLTNRYLLRTARKQTALAERRAARGVVPARDTSDLERLRIIGERGAFPWHRPDHMAPTGEVASGEVRAELATQLAECESLLERLGDERGRLAVVTMSVADLGKIDIYEWLFFLGEHMRRHLAQLEVIAGEWGAR